MTLPIINPLPLWHDIDGTLLDGGSIYIGEAGANPETTPVATFWDKELTQAATQPLRTRGGYIVRGANPAAVYIAEDDYSVRAKNLSGAEVLYRSEVTTTGTQYQPLDSDLTAIAALATTSYGRALLTLANQNALKAATGIPDPLPLAGGTVTGNVNRSGAGPHIYHVDGALTSGRLFIIENGAADPSSLPGDIVFEKV